MPENPQPVIEPEPEAAPESASHQEASADTEVLVPESVENADIGKSEERSAGPKDQQRLPLLLLSAATALLVLVTAFLGIGYVRAKDDLAQRDVALAKQTAERDRLATQLTTERSALEAKLKVAETTAVDPAAYALIKVCVETHAQTEELMKRLAANPPGVAVQTEQFRVLVPAESGPVFASGPTPCLDAKPHLK